jgi:hypothetical protein
MWVNSAVFALLHHDFRASVNPRNFTQQEPYFRLIHLSMLEGKGEFVTVAGKINDLPQPERLYRSCGFEGEDI